jgi:hypothetical protein
MTDIDWGTIISLLPPDVAKWVRFVAEWVFTLSLIALAVKRGMGEPNPATDGPIRQRVFWLLKAIDWLAINSTPVRTMDKHRDALKGASQRPPPRTSIPPGAGMMLLLVLPLLALSCAATPLETHATIAVSSADVITEAGKLLQARLEAVERDAVATSGTREEARERVGRLRATYAPLEAAYEAVRLAHAAYLDAILRAHAEGRDRPEPDALLALSAAWVELVKRAEMLGLVLPEPGEGLAGLPGGGR